MTAKATETKPAATPDSKSAVPAKTEAKTEVLTGKEAAQSDMVQKLGRDIIAKTGEVAGLYLQLCLYIRKHSVAPKLVSFELTRLGFKRSRISEINRVSNASDDLFKQYEAKMIGFDKVLNMSRIEKPGTLPVASPAALLLEKNKTLNADEVDEIVKKENEPSGKGGAKKADPLKAAAMVLASKSVKSKVWRFKGCKWQVRIEPDKAQGAIDSSAD